MPGEDFYKGLGLGEQVLKFVEHHHDPATRHISAAEVDMLRKAAGKLPDTLLRSGRSSNGGRLVVVLAVIGAGAFVIRRTAPAAVAWSRGLGKKPQLTVRGDEERVDPGSEQNGDTHQNDE